MAREHVLQALLSIMSSATSSPWKSGTAGVKGELPLRWALRGRDPVEVVAASGLALDEVERALCETRREGEPGRDHQRLLRAGDDDVDAPFVLLDSAAPRPETASTTSKTPWRLVTSAIAWTSLTMPCSSRSAWRRRSRTRVLGQQAVELGRRRAARPSPALALTLSAVRLVELDPALAELAAQAAASALAPGRDQVRDGGIHRARPLGGEGQDIVLRSGRPSAASPAPARESSTKRGPRW